MQPAIGHAKDVAERIRHRVVEWARRERRADAERVAAIGEFKIRLRRAGRNFAVADARLPCRRFFGQRAGISLNFQMARD